MSEVKRILVVDDEENNLRLLQAMLEPMGYRTESATDGPEALKKLHLGIDLVLLDVMMPQMNGFEVVKRIRKDPLMYGVPVIMVTVLTSKQDRLKAVEVGANDFITKPVDQVELRVRMESLLTMKEAQDALREREARYRTLVENSPVGIVSCDPSGNVTEINPALERILGIPAAENSRDLNLLSHPALLEAGVSAAIRKCLESGDPGLGEFTLRSRNGRDLHIRAHPAPIRDENGSVVAAQAVIEDITDQKRAEGLIVRSERLRALVEMAAGVAQNFSKALQVVTADSQMAISSLEAGSLSEVRPLLEEIRSNAYQAGHTVRRLQQFVRSRAVMDESQGKFFDLSDTLMKAIKEAEPWWKGRSEENGVEVRLETDPAPECFIQGEEYEIIEVLVNLLKNAAEALADGGLIKVKTYVEGGWVILDVKDNGVGIPKRNIKKVGEPFWTTKPDHSGMGLAVSFGIIRRHRGTVAVTSKQGKGTTFTVRLPHKPRPVADKEPQAEADATQTFHLLIVDGDHQARTSLKNRLTDMGHQVLAAATSEEALEELRRTEVDAVVFDLAVVGSDGNEISSAINSICGSRGISRPPLIVMADEGVELNEDEIPFYREIDRIVAKPIDAERLVEVTASETKGTVGVADTAFSGRIEGIDILEYVQLMLFTGRRVILEIRSRDDRSGLLYVDAGEVRHATCGDLEGEEALYRCLSFEGGSFSSLPWNDPEKITINKPSQFLLIEAARKRDETRALGRGFH